MSNSLVANLLLALKIFKPHFDSIYVIKVNNQGLNRDSKTIRVIYKRIKSHVHNTTKFQKGEEKREAMVDQLIEDHIPKFKDLFKVYDKYGDGMLCLIPFLF